ncbi:mediator of RNA polymerase II transcription subunit 23-like isoform X3 [Corticium candelabrum]|nr:mediator of RNA polymerase II transcription subunit 23-like isoform X2 [Corticium candelabrum]XP_062520938.1 mediator of RNA polymerase II transcription subunit 23-like isoform X3 [Corticium candelabrum]
MLSGLLMLANKQTNHQRFIFCFNLLTSLAESGVVPYKLLFETLIHDLDFNSSQSWMESFSGLSNHIQKVDYKVGCRELLILVLIKLCECPRAIPADKLSLVLAAKNFVGKLLDRKSGLLPGYIAYSAIAKHFPEGSSTHWAFEEMWQQFTNTFIALSDLISVKGRSDLSPVVGFSSSSGNVWKLDSTNLKFRRNHVLPFSEEQNEAQTKLLKAVVSQPCSKDTVTAMLSLNRQHRQRCLPLEEVLVDLLVMTINKSESSDETADSKIIWDHLSSQLVFFVLSQFARFAGLVGLLYDKLCAQTKPIVKSRERLMWVLLQLFSPAIQTLQLSDLAPLFAIFKRLYPEQETCPLPELGTPQTSTAMAAAAVWMHMSTMLSRENAGLIRQPPPYLRLHLDYLSQDKQTLLSHAREPLQIACLCNAFISVQETVTQLMSSLVERWSGGSSPLANMVAMPGACNLMAVGITEPCPLEVLDSLTTYAKMSLWNSVLNRVLKPVSGHGHLCLSPALVETYSRLMVYMEMDYGLALKTFLGQAIPSVCKQNNKPTVHTFLELLTYRLQRHIQPHYRLQLLGILYQLNSGSFGTNYQLQLSIESTALRLLVGLGSTDLPTQMAKVTADARLQNIGMMLSPDSEELNRLFVLVLARSIHIGCLEIPPGGWVDNAIRQAYNMTPHSWPQHVLNCMPESVRVGYRDFPAQSSFPRPEDKQALLNTIDEEWRKWT